MEDYNEKNITEIVTAAGSVFVSQPDKDTVLIEVTSATATDRPGMVNLVIHNIGTDECAKLLWI